MEGAVSQPPGAAGRAAAWRMAAEVTDCKTLELVKRVGLTISDISPLRL